MTTSDLIYFFKKAIISTKQGLSTLDFKIGNFNTYCYRPWKIFFKCALIIVFN